ncbi:hypothetical protein VaNZ11_017194 [Volvox africanus]|uniref:Uncharacterized protein n=1 Tax=Volvox africanus TaxID=51714 RepID=A0ABQ5SQS9_9CHLO|nr:hypothetical protein VaNZ11_017194 [Volvox africanus]
MLAVLAVCSGRSCSHPFQVLHTDGSVSDLWDAMDEQYDDMYDAIPAFSFGRCLPYQDLENEWSSFRGAVVPDCAENGSAWSAPRRVFFADVGPHAGSREAFRHGNSDAGDVFVIVESELESAAVPLPAKYQMVTDVYGSNAARDAILLA